MLAVINELYNSRNLTVDKAEQRVRTIYAISIKPIALLEVWGDYIWLK